MKINKQNALCVLVGLAVLLGYPVLNVAEAQDDGTSFTSVTGTVLEVNTADETITVMPMDADMNAETELSVVLVVDDGSTLLDGETVLALDEFKPGDSVTVDYVDEGDDYYAFTVLRNAGGEALESYEDMEDLDDVSDYEETMQHLED